jgi:acetyl-CoA acetyltransferase
MDTDVWILGGYQSDFARNLTKEGLDFADLTREIVDAALTAAKVNAGDIGVVHVANAFGEMFAEQGHLGAMPATVCAGLWDTPASRHEAACASGSVAALAAMADLRSGNYDTALVLGVELEKTVPGDTAARHLGLGLQQKLDRAADDPYVLPHVRAAALDALRRAQASLDVLDGIEVHDCFTPSEYLAIDHIGLTGPGESWKAVENGEIENGGRLPINPSGGLIGGGHPVGASGVRMLVDAAKQVSGAAGEYQVEDAKTFGTLNFGGSTATTVSFVVSTTKGS